MITFFTTFKDFKGKNRVNQLNAIRSWLVIDENVEVIIFSESDGIESVLNDNRVIHIQDVERYENRIPLIGPMFNTADRIAKNKICCFINGDIMITKKFAETIVKVNQKIRENYLFVGQRNNLDVEEEINFSKDWEHIFFEKNKNNFELSLPYAMDYFVFSKGQFQDQKFPTLLVGRPGWDLWMIYNAFKRKMTTVDLSFTVQVIHQNHDYNHKIKNTNTREKEDNINYKAFPFPEYHFFTAQTCEYIFEESNLKQNYAREDIEFYLRMKINLKENKFYNKLLLLLVSEHSILSNSFTKMIGTNLFNNLVRKSLINQT